MTAEHIQRELRRIGLRPQIAAGQNFLFDTSVVESMIDAAGVQPDDTVLEIGPGLGILTQALLETGAKVIAIELDKRLSAFLNKKFAGRSNLTLMNEDIFKVNLSTIVDDGAYTIVANLPYSATSLFFRNFLTLPPRPESITVMIQRDVAARITAPPGQLSVLGVMVQYYSHVERLFDVSPESFFPRPAVTSTVVHCYNLKPVDHDADRALFRVVRAGFAARRKLLANNLASLSRLPATTIAKKLETLGLKPTARAQEIPVETWPKIAEFFS